VVRRMSDPAFEAEQRKRRFGPHVEPINGFVAMLRSQGRGGVPEIAPCMGGVDALVLSVLRDPGPMTQQKHGGSGFLCIENDGQTAENQCKLFAAHGISPRHVLPWNAYPGCA
jgi:hypothetical protein